MSKTPLPRPRGAGPIAGRPAMRGWEYPFPRPLVQGAAITLGRRPRGQPWHQARQAMGNRHTRRRWVPSGSVRGAPRRGGRLRWLQGCDRGSCDAIGGCPEGRSRGSFLPGLRAEGNAQPRWISRDRDFKVPTSDSGCRIALQSNTPGKPGGAANRFRNGPQFRF